MGKNGFRVFDSDMHIMEPPDLWERRMPAEFRSSAPRGVTSVNVRDLRLEMPGRPIFSGVPPRGRTFDKLQLIYAEHARRSWSPECQLEAMEIEGIDTAIMFPSRGLLVLTMPDMEPRYAHAIARAYNDWLHEFCSAAPGRMYGAAMISVFDIGHAVEETHRAVEELGFRAVFLRANMVNGKPWHDRYYTPLWNALEKLDIPLGFHEASASFTLQTGQHFDPNFGMRRVVSQPFEQMLALNAMLTGGVLARHPKLRVAFLEANCSWVPWLVWRMDEAYELEGDVFMPDLTRMPSSYFRDQCYVSVEPDEHPVKYYLEEFGNDRLVYSTDYPHGDSRYPHATESLLELDLTDEDKRKILWDNCAEFYGIKTPTEAAS